MSRRFDDITPQYAADLHRQGEVETAAVPRKSRRWIGRLAGLVFVGVCVGAALIVVMKLVNDPAQAEVSAASLKASIAPTPTPMGTLNGLYLTLQYPGRFNQVSQIKTDPTALEQYNLGSSTTYRRQITVDIKNFPAGSPHEDAGYRLREIQADTYTPSVRTVLGETVYLMKKKDNTEVALFWPHAGKLLSAAITSSEPGDHVDDFLAQLLPTVRWK